jgi:hypothetical protein
LIIDFEIRLLIAAGKIRFYKKIKSAEPILYAINRLSAILLYSLFGIYMYQCISLKSESILTVNKNGGKDITINQRFR